MVKEMPNLVGVMARPRLRKRLRSLNSFTAAWRASRPPADSTALSQHVWACMDTDAHIHNRARIATAECEYPPLAAFSDQMCYSQTETACLYLCEE